MLRLILFVLLAFPLSCRTTGVAPPAPPSQPEAVTGGADHAHHAAAHEGHVHRDIPPPTGEIAVSLFVDEQLKGAFTVAPARKVFGAPAVTIWNTAPVLEPAGRTISGFRFSAWMEGNRAKIAAWALVNPAGVPEVAMNVEHHEVLLDTWLADVGDDIVLEPMRELGVKPVVLRVRDAAEAFAHEH